MGALTYVIIGLLAAAQNAAGCGAPIAAGCSDSYTPVYSDEPGGSNFMCIKLDKAGGVRTYHGAKTFCEAEGGYLAEPIGFLHEAIYELILCKGYETEAFWIGGTDEGHADYWQWETSLLDMPIGTPHWHPCEPSQPLISDNANHACMWEPDFYFFSCTENIQILAMCQMNSTMFNE